MIASASPLALVARSAPMGDTAVGGDMALPGAEGFAAIFDAMGPDTVPAAASQPSPTAPQTALALPLATMRAARVAMGSTLPEPATETGKKLPLALPETAMPGDDTAETAADRTATTDAGPALAMIPATIPAALPVAMPVAARIDFDAAPLRKHATGEDTPAADQATAGESAAVTPLAPLILPIPVGAPVAATSVASAAATHADQAAAPAASMASQTAPSATGTAQATLSTTAPAVAAASDGLAARTPVQISMAAQASAPEMDRATQAAAGRATDAAPARPVSPTAFVAPATTAVAAAPMVTTTAAINAMSTASGGTARTSRNATAPVDSLPQTSAAQSLALPDDNAAAIAATATPVAQQAPVQAALAPATATPLSTAAQDVARIVEQLSAAREMMAPATAALTVDHAELGPINLQLEQRADGGLSVQLAGATPEAHRAVTAAVTAQAPQQDSAQSASASSANTGAGTGSGTTTDRDGRNSNGQPQQNGNARDNRPMRNSAQAQASGNTTANTGIYA